jgi:predicted SprT family Zn-dependent metalloprotease
MRLVEARLLALSLFHKHNLSAWVFVFIHAKQLCGRCWIPEKVIGLSKPIALVNSPDTVEQILLHEIAHALSGRRDHGREWKETARRIGCRELTSTIMVEPVPGKWRYRCGNCRAVYHRHRRPKTELSCGKCRGKVLEVVA